MSASRQAARSEQAFRHHHAEAVGEARHQAGRLLDHRDRRVQPDAVLYARLGVAGRSREKVERVRRRSGMAAARAKTEEAGPIVANVKNFILAPTPYSSVK